MIIVNPPGISNLTIFIKRQVCAAVEPASLPLHRNKLGTKLSPLNHQGQKDTASAAMER